MIDFPLSAMLAVLGFSLFALFQPMHSGLTLTMINAKMHKYESHKNLPLFLLCHYLLRFLLRRFREKMWKPPNRKTHRRSSVSVYVCVQLCVCVCVSVLWPAQFLWHQSLTLPLRQAMATNQRSQRHKLLLSFCCYALWIYCETNAKRKKKTNKSEKPLNGTPSVLYTCIFLSPPIVLYSVLVLYIHITGRIEQ